MKLPEWLETNLPAIRQVREVKYAEKTKKFYVEGTKPRYDSIVELYDDPVHRNDKYTIIFSDEACAAAGFDSDNGFYFAGNRLLLVMTDKEHRELVEHALQESVALIREWRKDKTDFRASYAMLDRHPAFWQRRDENPTFYWYTSDHVQGFWHALSDDGMMMETGSHVEPEFTSRYHDLRLDTYGKTFEDCIIATAALVDKFYREDGVERENVKYKKSPLELLLEERIKELEDNPLE